MSRPSRPPTPPADSGNSTEKQRGWREKVAIGISIAALIVAGLSAGFTLWQVLLVNEGNRLTRANNIVSQRAFVYPTLSQVYISPNPFTAPQSVNFIFFLTNSGNTATRDLDLFIKCQPSAEDVKEPWYLLYQGPDKIEKYPSFVGPHSAAPTGCSFTFPQIKEMAAGRLHGYIMIDISYFDRIELGITRRTHTALKLAQITAQDATATTPAQFVSIMINRGRHNCTDDECPKE